jgi:hypothetical protein
VGCGIGGWFFLQHQKLAIHGPASAPAASVGTSPGNSTVATTVEPPRVVMTDSAPKAEFTIEPATEREIRDHRATDLSIFRTAQNPSILVLDFATLRDQGAMFNRVGAFSEKLGQPHDHVLNDAELTDAIRVSGDTPETYYYGHDYSSATLVRFFALADRDKIVLNSQEERLRRFLRQEGLFDTSRAVGVITIPNADGNPGVSRADRAAILRHEMSHGEYFSNPVFAEFVHRFWNRTLSQTERDHLIAYLKSQGYDTTLSELVENEAQAYLVFTLDPGFFTAAMIRMSEDRRAALREAFLRDMPSSWLRDQAGTDPVAQ